MRSSSGRPAGGEAPYRRCRPARLGASLLGAALLGALAGCGAFDDPPPCPGVNVLQQARQLTLYGDGSGRDLSDVTFEVELAKASADCDHDIDEEEGGGVEVTFSLPIRATRGPAAETDRVSVPYFVALVDGSREIVAKEVFTVEIAFEDASSRARTVEEIEQWIPLGPGETGAAYETLIGIQLTPAQLEAAQRRRRR